MSLRNCSLASGILLLGGQITALHAQEKSGDAPGTGEDSVIKLEKYVAEEKTTDTTSIMANRPTGIAFGFDKPLMDTPRAITIVSSEMLDLGGLRSGEDLVKVAPATYSNFRFGLQGNISIRNQTSDFYFRGMKRLDPQGNFRTVYTANDSLEIVEGPASPIYGLGRIGGYVNFNPKSGRASTGKYLEADTGSLKVTYGSFDKKIVTGDISGPLKVFGKEGGYSIYGYFEDSGSWKVNGFHSDQIIQGTYSANMTKDMRLESGFVIQHSYGGLPGGDNRTTRDTIATNTYWSGGFSYKLDENGDGRISEREIRNSYFFGTPQANALPGAGSKVMIGTSPVYNPGINDPFFRTVPWQGGLVNGGTITMDQFNTGYTANVLLPDGTTQVQTRKGYQLMVYPTMPDGNVYPKGSPGQIPNTSAPKQAFYLPPGFDIDASTWVQKPWNKRMSHGEDYYRANVGAFFLDLVNDSDPDQTYKNQIFIDTHKQVKDGRNGFSQWQHPTTFEDKVTFSRKFQPKKWWSINTLASANVYRVWTSRIAQLGDIDFRRDLQRDGNNIGNTFTSNDWITSLIEKPGIDGGPVYYDLESKYTVSGVGLLIDQTFFGKLNLIVGGRWDYVDAHSFTPANIYARSGSTIPNQLYVGGPAYTIANSGAFSDRSFDFKGNSNGPTESVSLVYLAPYGIRPYVTLGRQTILLSQGSAQELTLPQTLNALVGQSELVEAGIKGSLFNNKLTYTFIQYQQTRAAFDPITTVSGGPSSTISRGTEVQAQWQITKNFFLRASGSWSQAKYQQGGTVSVLARDVGYPDVVDASGKIVIPSEAFGWGGRLQTIIPDSEKRYREVEGIPDHVVSVTAAYNTKNYFAQLTMYNQGGFSSDRLDTIKVPQAYTFDVGFGYRNKKWEVNSSISNILNRKIYNRGAGFGWVDPKFPLTAEISFVRKF